MRINFCIKPTAALRKVLDAILGRFDGIEGSLQEIFSAIQGVSAQGVAMNAALDRLTQEVAENKTIMESATTLLDGLAQQIRDLKADPAALEALADELDANSNALATAVAANTPAAPPV